MKCETCQGRGFTELEHGLIQVRCSDCEGTGEIADKPKVLILSERMGNGESLEELENKAHEIIEASKDGNSGAGPDNQPIGSETPLQHKQSRKPKARKKTAKRPG